MLAPDNFLYFISLFFISIFSGTYLFFAHYRNRLLILNVLMLFGCAIRVCTEYYLPKIDSFESATNLAIFHSIVTSTISFLLWYCAWFYIRPFKQHPKEKSFNQVFVWIFLVLPFCVGVIQALQRSMHYFHTEKIDGYWQFQINTASWLAQFSVNYLQFMTLLTVLVLVSSLWKRKNDRLRKLLLLISYILFPFFYFTYLHIPGVWNIPNVGGIFVAHTLIISWYVSDYRLFHNNYDQTTNDVLNSISELVISTDLDLRITNTNNNAAHLVVGKERKLIDFLANASKLPKSTIKSSLNALITKEQKELELEFKNDTESPYITVLKVAPFFKEGQHLGYTFLLSDLTDIRAKEQQLTLLNNTKDQLFAIISHDLRKPALAFRGISKKLNFLIQQKQFDTLEKFGHSLEQSAFSINKLLDNLLNWALRQNNVLPYQPMLIDVKEAMKELYDTFSIIANKKGVALILNIEHNCSVYGDPNAFRIIFRNLIDNAIKYTPKGGTVELNTQQVEEGVMISVADTGIGIPQEKLEQLFNFEQNKSTQGTDGESGSGLGLTLVRDLVELNNGSIQVTSKGKEGTIFEVLMTANNVTLITDENHNVN